MKLLVIGYNLLVKNKLIIIILLASFLRLHQLGTNPPSLDWDEVSLGYNAYSLLKTGNDEYGNSWPFSIRSFNDYKPPAYTYLAIPSIAFFGLNDFAVRLPSALAGIVAVATIYFLTQELIPRFPKPNNTSPRVAKEGVRGSLINNFPLLSAFFLAISPWHLQFSRAAFEANVALTFYLLAITFFLKWINLKKKAVIGNWLLVLTSIFAVASLYSYHSARLVVPLFFFFSAVIYFKKIKSNLSQLIIPVALGLTLLSPLLYISFRGATTERFSTVSIFTNPGEFSRERERLERQTEFKQSHSDTLKYFHAQKLVFAQIITRNYFEHFNFDFLFLRADGNPRHHASGMGLLYLAELPLLLAGLYYLAAKPPKHAGIVWLILLLGPTASSLTASTPHAIRGMLMLPALIISSSYGTINLYHYFKEKYSHTNILVIGYCLLFLINIFYYLNLYYVVTPVKFSQDWQYGYRQLVQTISPLQANYTDIIITNKYDQPHIYFAFYQKIDPLVYQQFAETAHQQIDNLHFQTIESTDFQRPNTLVVTHPDKTPAEAQIIDQIKFLNGDIAFNLIEARH